jgi:energy-coupling factor transporter transmembrane protein EcfT
MKYHYIWLIWSIGFLVPWTVLYLLNPQLRKVMWSTSAATALLGLSEPLFVPIYWNPPSIFELARRTGFDIESIIFTFAIGGIGVALYLSLTGQHLVPVGAEERSRPHHRFHLATLLLPFVLFVPLYFLPWNPIYAGVTSLVVGAIASVICRPDLWKKTVIGGFLFLGIYAAFMLSLLWFAPGYIGEVWNLAALSGGLIYGIPVEELLFGFAFGLYWTGAYEHFTWNMSAPHPAPGRIKRRLNSFPTLPQKETPHA